MDWIAKREEWDATKRRRITIAILRDDLIHWLLENTKAGARLSLNADILLKCAELRALEELERGT